MLIANVVGQQAAKDSILRAAAQARLSHAYQLKGPAGIGKLPLALAMARYLLCAAPTDACGVCASCRQAAQLQHPDLHVVYPIFLQKGTSQDELIGPFREAIAANPYLGLGEWAEHLDALNKQLVIPIQTVRELKHKLTLKSHGGKRRVVVLWHAEKLNIEAANAFLKLLEEPPPNTTLLLTVEQPADLLPTLNSRCQRLPVTRLSAEAIAAKLLDEGCPQEAAEAIAHIADGSYARALQLHAQGGADLLGHFQQWMRLCYEGRIDKLQEWLEPWARGPKEQLKLFLEYAQAKLRDVLMHQVGATHLSLATQQEAAFLAKFAPTLSMAGVERVEAALTKAYSNILRNANAGMVLLDLSLSWHRAFKQAKQKTA